MLVVLASKLGKRLAAIAHPNCMVPQAAAANGCEANTAKVGMACGRTMPGIGTFRLFRDVLNV